MNTIVKFMKESRIVLFVRIIIEMFRKAVIDAKWLANSGRSSSPVKLQQDLTIRIHAIEKGMSIGNIKVGFGKDKALAIIRDLAVYIKIGGNSVFANEICSILTKYVEYNKALGADMDKVEKVLNEFVSYNHVHIDTIGGIFTKNHQKDVINKIDGSFAQFSQSRYSIRDFGNSIVDVGKIHNALKLCERTPSACNRQSWRVYVYGETLKNKVFEFQGGTRGFYEEMQYAILICGDQRQYNINELHQVYVDGGLYAMNLIYSLHSEGLATIPLTMAHKTKYSAKIKKELGIPVYEMPVLLIGVGTYKSDYKVAVSMRNDYHEYVNFIN